VKARAETPELPSLLPLRVYFRHSSEIRVSKKTSTFGNIVDGFRATFNLSKAVTSKFDLLGQQKRAHEERSAYLMNKYRDPNMVQALLVGQYWVGQHHEQLRDALGPPAAIDRKNMATRQREIWKYQQTGVNRYGLRITLDDGIVTTWDSKNDA
jgi:hypothetical protein